MIDLLVKGPLILSACNSELEVGSVFRALREKCEAKVGGGGVQRLTYQKTQHVQIYVQSSWA